jgi:hypothetical protein
MSLDQIKTEMKKVAFWLKAAGVTAFSGGGFAVLAAYADPSSFNTTFVGLQHLGFVFLGGAIIGLLKWILPSPFAPKPPTPPTP